MTDKTIRRVRELDAAATKGPWKGFAGSVNLGHMSAPHVAIARADSMSSDEAIAHCSSVNTKRDKDAALIVYYRTAAPALADEVERLRARIAKLDVVVVTARCISRKYGAVNTELADLDAALHTLDEDSGGSGAAHSPTAMKRPGATARDEEVRGRFACGCEVGAHKYGWVLTAVCHHSHTAYQYSDALSMIRAGYAIAASRGVGPWAKKALEDSGGSA